MTGELEAVVREIFDSFDRKDFDAGMRHVAEDVQQIDELSRRWIRSRNELWEYVRGLEGLEDISSTLSDLHEVSWSDGGIVTCWLEQDYRLDGQQQHISSPTTVVFRRDSGQWRVVLFHAVPLA